MDPTVTTTTTITHGDTICPRPARCGPPPNTKLGERAFSYAGPVVWNNLSEYIPAEPDITRFKNILKTYFFRLAFDLLG